MMSQHRYRALASVLMVLLLGAGTSASADHARAHRGLAQSSGARSGHETGPTLFLSPSQRLAQAGAVPSPASLYLASDEAGRRAYLPYARSSGHSQAPATQLGHLGGASFGIQVRNGIAYVAQGPRLLTLDVSAPADPRELGRSPILADTAFDLALAGDLAYVANGRAGVTIHSIADPSRPVPIAGAAAGRGLVRRIALDGSRAYTLEGRHLQRSTLRIWDVSDPLTPRELGSMELPYVQGHLAVSGSHLYAGIYNSALWVIDVAAPSRPRIVGQLSILGLVYDLAVRGNRAYLASGGLKVVDVAEPRQPELIVDFNFSDGCRSRTVVVGTDSVPQTAHAVCRGSDGPASLRTIGLTNLEQPASLGAHPTWSPSAGGLALADDSAYVVNGPPLGTNTVMGDGGVEVFDLSQPLSPSPRALYHAPGAIGSIALADGRAYVTDMQATWAVSLDDTSQPRPIGVVDAPPTASASFGPGSVTVAQGLAYTATAQREGRRRSWLQALDTSGPDAVREIGRLEMDGEILELASVDRAALALMEDRASGTTHLVTVELDGAGQMVEVGRYKLSGRPIALLVVDRHAYLTGWRQPLYVYDVTSPHMPRAVGEVALPDGALDLAWNGQHLFAADHRRGLHILSLADPAAPQVVGRRPGRELTPQEHEDGMGYPQLDCNRLRCFMTATRRGIEVLNITNPALPEEMGFYRRSWVTDVAASEAMVLTAESIDGLAVIDPNRIP